MRNLLTIIACLLSGSVLAEPAPRPLPWSCNVAMCIATNEVRMYGPTDHSDIEPWTGVYVRADVGNFLPAPPDIDSVYGPQARATWHTVDLSLFGIPSDAPAVNLSGVLIATPQVSTGIAEVRVAFRKFGSTEDPTCQKYIGQTVGNGKGIGSRSNMAVTVPLSGGKFEFCYVTPPATVATYGINLSLQSYMQGDPQQAVGLVASMPKRKKSSKPVKLETTGSGCLLGKPWC